nr:hypothetical protein RSP597_08505 [Ralstonia solanacearum]
MLLLGSKGPTVSKAAKAIGLLYDYYVLDQRCPTLDERGLHLLIRQFYGKQSLNDASQRGAVIAHGKSAA